MKDLLKTIIFEQQEYCKDMVVGSIPRNIEDEWLTTDDILIITGVRRCGKSVLLQQLRHRLPEKDFFFNFDDERLINFELKDFQVLQECFFEIFGRQHTYYFDEIQNIPGWEMFVRRLHNEGAKVIVTGSNARMLSRELGTHLTGRYIAIEIYPFSFKEHLSFTNQPFSTKDFYTTAGRARLAGCFREYLEVGGFPRYVKTKSKNYLTSLYESIIFRDVLSRNKLTNDKELQEMLFYLASNATKRITYNSLGKAIGIKHPETVKNYIGYIEQTYLIGQLTKYSPSVKIQMANPKKIYFVDNAIIGRIGFNATDNIGVKLENLMYVELKRRGYDLFYHSDKKECDFIVRQGAKVTQVFQVTMSMSDPKTRSREIEGLCEAMEAYNLKEGFIITIDEEDTVATSCGTAHIVPAWKFILQPAI